MESSRGLFLSAGAAALAAGFIPTAVRAQTLVPVSLGYLRTVTDAPLIVAQAKGFFRDVGLDVTMSQFSSAAFMIAPMGVGQLEIGAGAPVAGLYNAVAHGVDLKIVADKCIDSRGYGFDKVVVRKDLIDSGKYKGPADLRGLNFGRAGRGTSVGIQAAKFLKTGGLDYHKDIQAIDLDFPNQVVALKNRAIDWTIAIEPFPTLMVNQGSGTVVTTDAEIYPDQEVADILYSGSFMKNRPAVAQKFMLAYMRGLRYYYESLKDGHIVGKNGDEVVGILAKGLNVKPELLRQITPSDVNPNGYVNMKSLLDDYATFQSWGFINKPVDVKSIVDMSFVDAVVKELGVYKV
jgi:NitT/TauT family transport system substrate-binding protein